MGVQQIKNILDEPGLSKLAGRLAEQAASQPTGVRIYLEGEIGAGKTTFARAFIQALGHRGPVKSPTYNLVHTYELPGATVHHFDLYRLHSADELEAIGFNEYLTPDAIILIEWPERVQGCLPSPDMAIKINVSGEKREVAISAETEQGVAILSCLQ